MFGFVLGTLSLLGLIALAMGGRHHHRWHHGDDGPWEDHHRGGGGWQRFGWAARRGLRRHLDLREEQEEVVSHAVRDVGEAIENLVTALKDSREDIARAFRGDTLDEVRLATVFEGHDDDLRKARKDVVAALKEAHAVLDPEQRGKAADLFHSGPGRWV